MKTFLAKLQHRKILIFVINWIILEIKVKEEFYESLLQKFNLLFFYYVILCNYEVNLNPALGADIPGVIIATHLSARKDPW